MDMTAFKVSFRYDFDPDSRTDKGSVLQSMLNTKHISYLRMYAPSRNAIKVLFYDENDLNKVFSDKFFFESIGFYPKISRTLKTKRTIFCFGFDASLLQTYDKNDIKDSLEKDDWLVTDVYIMRHNRSFKIEFLTIHHAIQFLNNRNTSIGGIKINIEHKINEVNSSIDQCWGCGHLQTNHTSETCQTQICLY